MQLPSLVPVTRRAPPRAVWTRLPGAPALPRVQAQEAHRRSCPSAWACRAGFCCWVQVDSGGGPAHNSQPLAQSGTSGKAGPGFLHRGRKVQRSSSAGLGRGAGPGRRWEGAGAVGRPACQRLSCGPAALPWGRKHFHRTWGPCADVRRRLEEGHLGGSGELEPGLLPVQSPKAPGTVPTRHTGEAPFFGSGFAIATT